MTFGYGGRLHRWDIERRRRRWDRKGGKMTYPPTGLDHANSRNLEQITVTLQGILHELRRIADLLETTLTPAAPQDPPDVSWVQTESIKADYGRDPKDVDDWLADDDDATKYRHEGR